MLLELSTSCLSVVLARSDGEFRTSCADGSTDGSIRIDYGHIDDALYTRQITLPVLLTVFHTLESHSLNLVRLDDNRCLLAVDVRNVYGQPFEVALDGETTVTRLIPPGSTERLLLPIQRKTVQPKPIPSLSDRQFVVAKETTDEVLFWHREKLLSSFTGRWQEVRCKSNELIPSLEHFAMALYLFDTSSSPLPC